MTQLVYDGTFDGFLTSIFEAYEKKLQNFTIVRCTAFQPSLLGGHILVPTDQGKSLRVWEGLIKKLSRRSRNDVYKSFLSEIPEMEGMLTQFMTYVFKSSNNVEADVADRRVLAVTQTARMVHREKHRMEAFIRFQRMKDDVYYAAIAPDFNVIPLLVGHFKDRYADQHWLIYDKKRNYGIQYDHLSRTVTEVSIQFADEASHEFLPESMCHEEEAQYQRLWRDYFYSVNIGQRNNRKLHVQHVPVRYWRYLTEKQPAER